MSNPANPPSPGAPSRAAHGSGTAEASPATSAAEAPPAQGYAGDLTPQQAFDLWQQGEAVLVDVRSDAEREWVGFVPGALALAWKQWPGMAFNDSFDTALLQSVAEGKKALMLCRSGVRSIAAARRATELGLEAYNILEGFEGDADPTGHRGTRGGWRLRGLPWRQN